MTDAAARPEPAKAAAFEDGSITVCVRARPINERETKLESTNCLRFRDGKTVTIFEQGYPENYDSLTPPEKANFDFGSHTFTFDHAYDPVTEQSVLYDDMGRMVLSSSFRGFNTCIFAYGQTGSGKSYCMMGPNGGRDVENAPGIIPRLCQGLFAEAEDRRRANHDEISIAKREGVETHALPPELEINVYVSYLEIYREKVRCLLNPKDDQLKVRQHPTLGVYVEGLKEVPVNSEDQVLKLMAAGTESRHIASTNMNDTSSRSHAIFALQLIQKRKSATKGGAPKVTELRSKINLVDLAGSERAKQTGAEGDTLKEGAQINKSLTMLGIVISALADASKSAAGKRKHIPYRDSTLTYLLKESLGGNSKTIMLSTLSPAQSNYDETLSTLRYADRAKAIVTRAFINETAGDKRIRELEDEVTRLRDRIRLLQERPDGAALMKLLQEQETTPPRGHHHHMGSPLDDGVSPDAPTLSGEGDRSMSRSSSTSDIGREGDYVRPYDSSGSHGSGSPVGHLPSSSEQDVDILQSELRRAEEVIKQSTATEVEREQEVAAVLEQYKAQSTVRLSRRDPYLLNMDGAGDWIVAHLVGNSIRLGAPEGKGKQGEEESSVQYITIPVEYPEQIGAPHCILCPLPNGSFAVQPCEGHRTYLNEELNPLERDTFIKSGDIIMLGADGPQFKFMDPAAPPLTARVRRGGQSDSSPTTGQAPVYDEDIEVDSDLCSDVHDEEEENIANEHGDDDLKDSAYTISNHDDSNLEDEWDGDLDDDDFDVADDAMQNPVPPVMGGAVPPMIPSLQLGSLAKKNTGAPPVAVATPNATAGQPKKEPSPAKERKHVDPFGSHLAPAGVLKGTIVRDGDTSGEPGISKGRVMDPTAGGAGSNHFGGNEPSRFIGRHNLVFIGPAGAGKTYVRENLKRPDRWFSFLTAEKIECAPTWGIDRSIMDVEGTEDMKLLFTELSGRSCFTLLQDHLPSRRVTYVLCFSLQVIPTLLLFRQALELILCQSDHRDVSIVLLGTHLDYCSLSDDRLYRILEDLEQEVHNFFRMLQPNAEQRPVIVGRFAVDNVGRRVFSAGFARVETFPQLLHWLSDHALQRCKNDVDFLNGRIHASCERLAAMVAGAKHSGKWCLSSTDYKARARALDPSYQTVSHLHMHTQLLSHWGYLEHRFRHATMRSHIIVDVRWFLQLITTLACCGAASAERADEVMLCSLSAMRQFDKKVVPFSPEHVVLADGYGLLSKGVMTTRVLAELVHRLQRENITERPSLPGIVNLLQMCDYVVRGSHLCYSSGSRGHSPTKVKGDAASALDASDKQHATESFLLIPTTFVYAAPSAVVMYLPKLMTGPFYRFTFSMVPPHFFAKLTCRVARGDRRVYLGPVEKWPVDHDGPHFPLDMTSDGGVSMLSKSTDIVPAVVPGAQHFWKGAFWLLDDAGSRALIRMVNHSLFIAFFHADENDQNGEGALFYDSILQTVRDIVEEFPGAQCREGLLCARDYDDLEADPHAIFSQMNNNGSSDQTGGARCYYRAVDDNVNSLEKIRDRERSALLTARSRRGDYAPPSNEEDIIPYLQAVDQSVDVDGLTKLLRSTKSSIPERYLHALEDALDVLNTAKDDFTVAADARVAAVNLGLSMDAVIDALARV